MGFVAVAFMQPAIGVDQLYNQPTHRAGIILKRFTLKDIQPCHRECQIYGKPSSEFQITLKDAPLHNGEVHSYYWPAWQQVEQKNA